MKKINPRDLHVRPREGSPIPREIFDALFYGDNLSSLLTTIWTWAQTDDGAAAIKERMLDICIAKNWQPVHVCQEDDKLFISSGELDALAALHSGAPSIACVYDVPLARPPAPSPKEEVRPMSPPPEMETTKPTPPPPETKRTLDQELANFAACFHAHPHQPAGDKLVRSASYLHQRLRQTLPEEEVWAHTIGDRSTQMPWGWRPTEEQREKAIISKMSEACSISSYTVKALFGMGSLPAHILDEAGQLGLSFRNLRTVYRLHRVEDQEALLDLLSRRPLTSRQLEQVVSLCNKGLSVPMAVTTIDDQKTTSWCESFTGMIEQLRGEIRQIPNDIPVEIAQYLVDELEKCAETARRLTGTR